MSASASWQLQQSVYAALSANAPLTALLGGARIFDDVPQATPYPHVTLGQTSSSEYATGTEDGEEHILTLHVWSQGGGRGEAQRIMGAIRDALHTASLTLTGHTLVGIRQQFADVRRDPDGVTIHGLVRYRAVTEPA
jgi:Protein of unknown function (DUF3168)